MKPKATIHRNISGHLAKPHPRLSAAYQRDLRSAMSSPIYRWLIRKD